MKTGINSWKALVRFVLYYFSIGGLMRTFFVPWRREKYISQESGIWKWVEQGTFFMFAVVLGMVVRTLTILAGILSLMVVMVLFPIFLIFPIQLSFKKLVSIGSLGRQWAYPQTWELNKHGRDMRDLPEVLVIDHDSAIAQVERILSRKTQSNVLVVGGQGIGKTTRLGHLARMMYRDLSVRELNGKRLVQLFPEEMKSEEIQSCIKEAIAAKNVVLVIENIERLNILSTIEPYLDTNHFQVILTTDWGAYNSTYKHHDNLMRVTEVVEMHPPDDETTLRYLEDWTHYQREEKRLSTEILTLVIKLTNMLMVNKTQPEKSIDILEELITLEGTSITVAQVEELLSQKTNVPIGTLHRDEKEKLINLEQVLNRVIIGQEQAVARIASAMKRGRVGVTDSTKPIGSFLFLGPTGVGKTHTAKMLARYYFGGERMMIRFDMSEFRELKSLDRFIERLAAEVERTPFGLIFFDEIEKAHPDILNLFLQITDEGELRTPQGRTLSFRNTIIICTSNAGAIYQMQNDIESQDLLINHIVSEGILRPEFINRFDATVLYKSLDRNSIESITRIMLGELNEHLKKKYDLEVMVTDELVQVIARRGHDPKFGVRPLDRVIQEEIETRVAEALLEDSALPGGIIIIDPLMITLK